MCLAFLATATVCGAAEWTPGTTNHVDGVGATGAGYLLYLPTSFQPESPPPLAVYFDPGGDYGRAMGLLQPAFEQMGWSLACAKYLSNSGPSNQWQMARELLDDVRARVPHPHERFYLSGLSGGSWRANTLARGYWDEVAGLLLFGCWIGDYDVYARWPGRLAVARVNGIQDQSKIDREAQDDLFYHPSGVRTENFHWDGGHDIGPTTSIVAALTWLEADWVATGAAAVPEQFEEHAQAHAAAAGAAWTNGLYDTAVRHAMDVWRLYAMASSAARSAEVILVRIFGDAAARQSLGEPPAGDAAWDFSWAAMERALELATPNAREESAALYEAAIWACPTNARALSERAELHRRAGEWFAAYDRTSDSLACATNHWHPHGVRAMLLAAMGDIRSARAELAIAITQMKPYVIGTPVYNKRRKFYALRDEYDAAIQRIRNLPVREPFETLPEDMEVTGRAGWVVCSGTGICQTQEVRNGHAALALSGASAMTFLNGQRVTNAVVWVDGYLRRSASDATNGFGRLPPHVPAAFWLDADGRLRAPDGPDGAWRALEHPPLATGVWGRVTAGLDYSNQLWRLRLNDVDVATNLPFVTNTNVFCGFMFLHDGAGPTYWDNVSFTLEEPGPDGDLDGMDDAWEALHGLDPTDAADAVLDPDGDFYANLEEFYAGTNPHVADAPGSPPYAYFICDEALGRWVSMTHQPACFRHRRFFAEPLLVSATHADLHFMDSQTTFGAAQSQTSSVPCSGFLVPDGAFPLTLRGPLHGTFRVELDGDSGAYAVRFFGLNDQDGDGLADEWETYYYGHPTAAHPYGNPDGDAAPNAQEYLNHTSPLVPDGISDYRIISIPGSDNQWSLTEDALACAADHIWCGTFSRKAGTNEFKFAADGSWAINWGDSSGLVRAMPFRAVATRNAGNIRMFLPASGSVRVLFHERSGAYACFARDADANSNDLPDDWETDFFGAPGLGGSAADDPDGDGFCNIAEYLALSDPTDSASPGTPPEMNYPQITLAGTFNDWSLTASPMSKARAHLWRLETNFVHASNVAFKVTAGSWNAASNWGSGSASACPVPILAQGYTNYASNFSVEGPLNGRHRFTFHDVSYVVTLEKWIPPLFAHLTVSAWPAAPEVGWAAGQVQFTGLAEHIHALYLLPDLREPANAYLLGQWLPVAPVTTITVPLPTNYPAGVLQLRMRD